jgi:hypothetical protein
MAAYVAECIVAEQDHTLAERSEAFGTDTATDDET